MKPGSVSKQNIDLTVFIPRDTGYKIKKLGSTIRLEYCPLCGHRDCFSIPKNRSWFFKCFSCGQSGDVITYLMASRDIGFKEAISILNSDKIEPAPKAITEDDASKRVDVARWIWSKSRLVSKKEAKEILEQRGFPKSILQEAIEILCKVCKINSYKDEDWLIIPQYVDNELSGINRILVQDTHVKLDKGTKGTLFLQGKYPSVFVVESFFNGLLLNSVGYSTLIMFSATNKLSLNKYLDKNKIEPVFWLDRGVEKLQLEYCQKYHCQGVWFDSKKREGYDVNDLAKDFPNSFDGEVLALLDSAWYEPPYSLDGEWEKLSFEHVGKISSTQKIESVSEAFRLIKESDVKGNLVMAPTGAGKTTESIKLIAERIRKKQNVIYIANIKADMNQLYDLLSEELSPKELERVQMISRDDDKNIAKSTLAIITHKTFFTRKGFSQYHYSLMISSLTKRKDVWMIIDEMQSYVKAQNFQIWKGGRLFIRNFRDHGLMRKEPVQKCLVTSGKGNCSLCQKSDCNFIAADTNGIIQLKMYVEGKTGNDYKGVELKFPDTENVARYKTMNIADVKPIPQKTQRIYSDKRVAEIEVKAEEILDDMLSCAYSPKIFYSTAITKDNEEHATADQLAIDFLKAENMSYTKELAEKEKAKIREKHFFPHVPCETQILDFKDKSSLSYIAQKAEKVIMLSATLRENQKQFIEECFPTSLNFFKVEKANHALDELAVIVYMPKLDFVKSKELTILPVIDVLKSGQKALIFTDKKENAEILHKEFPKDFPVAIIGEDYLKSEKVEDLPPKVNITWPNGPLSRGINRPKDYLVIVDCSVYLPIINYEHGQNITSETIAKGYQEAAEDLAIQQGGRGLRGTGRKCVILHSFGDIMPNLQTIVSEWQGMVKTPIKTLIVYESQEYLLETAKHYLATGEAAGAFLDETEKDFLARKLSEKKKNEMSKKERTIVDSFLKEDKEKLEVNREQFLEEQKEKKILERLITKGLELKKAGKNKREIERSLHLSRYEAFKEIILQKLSL